MRTGTQAGLVGWAITLACLATGQEPAARTVASFETQGEVARWRTLGTQFERSSRFATQGEHSARLGFHRYDGATGEEQWPRVTAFADDDAYPTDWSPWAAIALDRMFQP